MKKIHVFDFDGTLVDSMQYFSQGMLDVVKKLGVSYPDDIINIITPLGYQKTAEYFVNVLGAKEKLENIHRMMGESLVYQYTYNVKHKPYVKEYLQKLKDQGCRLFVLTASPHLVLDVCMERNGIADFLRSFGQRMFLALTRLEQNFFISLRSASAVIHRTLLFMMTMLPPLKTAANPAWRRLLYMILPTMRISMKSRQAATYLLTTILSCCKILAI